MSEQARPAVSSDTALAEENMPAGGIAWARIVIWGTVFLLLAIVGWHLLQANRAQPTEGRAPDFSMTTFDGEEVHLADLRGQVVVLNFWASWCVPCIEEAPELEATWQAYKDQDVMFLGIDYLDAEAKGLAFLAEHGITYPNGPDLRQKISDDYYITGVPETFVIDPEGNITFHAALPINRGTLSREIEKARNAGS